MTAHLLIFYVDERHPPLKKTQLEEMYNLLGVCDAVAYDISLGILEKPDEIETEAFVNDVESFINDPLDFYFDIDEENEYEDEIEKIIYENEYSSGGGSSIDFQYSEDYMSVFIQFVSSKRLFKKFIELVNDFYVDDGNEFILETYKINFHTQTQIFKKMMQGEKKNRKKRGEKEIDMLEEAVGTEDSLKQKNLLQRILNFKQN